MPPKTKKTPVRPTLWLKVLGSIGLISTIVGLLYAAPTGYATYYCLFYGRYCQYALIGPDPEVALQKNNEAVRLALASPNGPSTFRGFRFVQVDSLLFSNRVDTYALIDEKNELAVDTFSTGGARFLNFDVQKDLAIATFTRAVTREGYSFAEALVILYFLSTRIEKRAFNLHCYKTRYMIDSPYLELRNTTWEPSERRIVADVLSTCALLTIDGKHIERITNPSYHARQTVGDRVELKLSAAMQLEGVVTKAKREFMVELERRYESQRLSLDACIAEEVLKLRRKFPNRAGLLACKTYELTDHREEELDRDYIIIVGRIPSKGEPTRIRSSCRGEDLDFIIDPDATYVITACYDDIFEQSEFKAQRLTLSGYTLEQDDLIFSTRIECRCGALNLEDVVFNRKKRIVEFDLRANSPKLVVDGKEYELGGPGQVIMKNIGRDVNAVHRGRYQLTFSERFRVQDLAKASIGQLNS